MDRILILFLSLFRRFLLLLAHATVCPLTGHSREEKLWVNLTPSGLSRQLTTNNRLKYIKTTLSKISVFSQHGGKPGQVGADMIGDDLPFGDGLTGPIEMATDGKVGNITV